MIILTFDSIFKIKACIGVDFIKIQLRGSEGEGIMDTEINILVETSFLGDVNASNRYIIQKTYLSLKTYRYPTF